MKILPKDVQIGDHIIIDPKPKSVAQEDAYFWFDDYSIVVEEITILPNNCFYFIYGGDQRDSIYIEPDQEIDISLTSILRKL